ncbi:uncharacterized protein si:dkeyp-13a3.10 isoform X3 [Oryzias melastigma]|uniref:uncharacterized protein si:dkeyp-13a3.10 isoform X3 n=1 Tax=Oryzias melastigma TaxID=30732 RepID=UPI00168D6EE1|nr:uncharacterized protein si:dkeyp-13a3.10 isoform X3 [Oryzias melastigma]XP_036072416.1 uncharacterized protein si:dkeyp-13a3.10 isoform X3 [Oryzias melastigma]
MRITELLFYSFIYFLLLSQLSKTAPFPPLDAIIVQIQHSGVVGGSYVAKQVLFNGLPLSNTSREVSHILQSLSTKELFPFNRSISQIPALKDHTIVCHQECVLESHRLQWSEHVFYDGEVYLRLEPNGTWTALVPQAVLLKGLLEQTGRHGGSERTRLQNGCMQLMKELRLPDKPSGISSPVSKSASFLFELLIFVPFSLGSGIVSTRILIPVLGVVAFAGLITVSILVSKNRGWTHPGGVIGSLIHYPGNLNDLGPDTKDSGYRTL